LVLLVSVLALGSFTNSATDGVPNEILVFASVDSVTTWDPSASYSTELTYLANIYEPLIWVNPPGSEEPFTPALAESWEVSDDGLTWIFHLRRGVKFHDGEPFNAEAVKYSYERTMEMGLGAAFILSPISEINVIDDYTVEFTLKYAAPLDRIVASAYAAWIMSPKGAEQGREWFEAGHEAGTGPYKLVSWKPDEEIVLEKFDEYWGGWEGPHFDRIIIKIVKEATVMQQLLESGEADLVSRVPPDALTSIDEREDLEVLRGSSFMNYAMHINTTKPPLDNKLVRQAIAYATPYADIIEVSVSGWGTQAVGPIPHGQFGHNEALYQYHHNLDTAKELLALAGYPNGIDRTLVLTYAAENTTEEKFAPLIKEELEKIGIPVEIRPMIWTSQWAWAKGEPTEAQDLFLLLWWPTFSDCYETLYSLWHSEDVPFFNLSYYKNPEYDELIDTAYTMSGIDPDQAFILYSRAQQLLIFDAPSVFLFDVDRAIPKKVCLRNYVHNPNYPRVPFFYQMYKDCQ
jgi:peptide/nickel transport system substrate-binding protein